MAADPRLEGDRTAFISRLSQRFQTCLRILKESDVSEASIHQVIQEAQSLEIQISRVRGQLVSDKQADDIQTCVHEMLDEAHAMLDQTAGDSAYRAPEVRPPGRGAAKKVVTKEQLEFFIELSMTATEMASAVQVSERTIWRRLSEHGLQLRQFTDLTDEELDEKVKETVELNRKMGAEIVRAHLKAKGVNVPRRKVRDAMERVDPVGVALRALKPKLERTRYSVAGPNSLWHIDGNHKLIRYRVVIHAGIDGYSRMVVFAAASPNNLASTVLGHFIGACTQYGIPSRIRVDQGVENADICFFMEVMRGLGRGSAIRGKSCHNQRVERLWVDMWKDATNVFYRMFAFMESRQLLDPSNDLDIWALHYVFVPRINRALGYFSAGYNNHGLSTEHGKTPKKLFAMGMLTNQNGNLTAVQDVFTSDGIPSPTELAPSSGNLDHVPGRSRVVVPSVETFLTPEQTQIIVSHVDPLARAQDGGMTFYIQARDLAKQLLEM